MLEIRGLAKNYGAVRAVRRADLTLSAGIVHALVGANGSGKSTVIKVLSGVLRPDEGVIRLDGRAVTLRNPEAAKRLGIATSFQDFSLIPTLGTVDNVVLATRKPRAEAEALVAELLERMATEVDVHAPVEELTVAQRMVVEALKAMAQDPKVLILDEATAALDQDQVERLFGVVRAMAAERGVAVLVVTHRLREVMAYCDRVTVMRDGVTVAHAGIEGMSEERLARLIVGDAFEPTSALPVPEGSEVAGAAAELRDVTGRRKVSGITLTVGLEEVVGVGGLQGQGQDELVRVAALMEPPQRGEARVLWGGALRPAGRGVARRAVLYISGDRVRRAVFYGRPIVDNLFAQTYACAGIFSWVNPARLVARARQVLDVLGVQADPEQKIETLSGGNQQRVVFGRLLVGDPTFLVLDDPTLGVDVHSRAEIHGIIRRRRGVGTLIYSSDDEELVDLCHRVVVLFDGRAVQELQGTALNLEALGHAMLGRHAAGSGHET